MKTKHFFMVLAVSFFFASCSEESENIATTTDEGQVLRFASQEAMNSKIAEIETFKANQEELILQKVFQINNFKSALEYDTQKGNKNQINESEKAKILEGAKLYHQEKLKAIYSERAHFGFTSIQSIADEINSLKVSNLTKMNGIFNQYKEHLTLKNHLVIPIYDTRLSNVLIPNTKIFVDGKELVVKAENTSGDSASRTNIKEGIVAYGYDNFVAITYHCITGSTILEYDLSGNSWYKTGFTNKLGCLVMGPTGYVTYPCFFNTNAGSTSTALVYYPSNGWYTLNFPSGWGSMISISGSKNTSSIPTFAGYTGNISGLFAVPVTGTSTVLYVSGSKSF